MSQYKATALARANIALAKYWGKSDVELNLPAVPSISMTLQPLTTETTVEFADALSRDELSLNDKPAGEVEVRRASALLDQVRAEAGIGARARVASKNHFPTASGLASSASGFAALAAAARAAAGLRYDADKTSALARRSSASAARSVFGGYVELPAGAPGDVALSAHQLFAPEHMELCIVVAVTDEGRKAVGSTDGMTHTRETSPYYASWIDAAPRLANEVREGLRSRDLPRIGKAMEQSTLAMHACGLAAAPGLLYWHPATLAAFNKVRELRESGVEVYATMDAGPHVKALCFARDASTVSQGLTQAPGVLRTILAGPGAGVEIY
jgi:diphosphomevalonate decarboxylase